ncbi:hypothetical protein C8R26_11287 [Nitrosomonas oligotropha]|uniref:Uncharacterized protein n=1 Tax=Nitrosomonas oligotropha TaxID=42354 RepID=A0A2T5HZE6_9PROT|nr:hypothetical protein C8R26_11287 [Nitrosomonas oligotropha]
MTHDNYAKLLGKLVGSFQSLEFMLRFFCKIYQQHDQLVFLKEQISILSWLENICLKVN